MILKRKQASHHFPINDPAANTQATHHFPINDPAAQTQATLHFPINDPAAHTHAHTHTHTSNASLSHHDAAANADKCNVCLDPHFSPTICSRARRICLGHAAGACTLWQTALAPRTVWAAPEHSTEQRPDAGIEFGITPFEPGMNLN